MRVELEMTDVLLDIESTIVSIFDAEPALTDRQVLGAIDALLRGYELERRRRTGRPLAPAGLGGMVYTGVHRVCEWKLGRGEAIPTGTGQAGRRSEPLTAADMCRCLKRLRKSIRMWHKEGGPQGYLTFVVDFLSDARKASRR